VLHICMGSRSASSATIPSAQATLFGSGTLFHRLPDKRAVSASTGCPGKHVVSQARFCPHPVVVVLHLEPACQVPSGSLHACMHAVTKGDVSAAMSLLAFSCCHL